MPFAYQIIRIWSASVHLKSQFSAFLQMPTLKREAFSTLITSTNKKVRFQLFRPQIYVGQTWGFLGLSDILRKYYHNLI
jgi:hypothetical protein